MSKEVKHNSIYIIEGYDGVGKDYYVKNNLSEKDFYRPNHELLDKFISRNDSYLVGFSIFDFLSRIRKTGVEVIINRCIASSLVYSELYNGRLHLHPNLDELIEFYKNNRHFQEANHIHVCHSSMESARKIYNLMSNRSDNEELDEFDGFLDYWKCYCNAELAFSKYYKMLGIKPKYIYNEYESKEIEDCDTYKITKNAAKNTGLCENCESFSKCYEKEVSK